MVRDADERERHWNDMAEMILTAVIAFVVVYGETIDQNLQMVAEIVSDPEKLDMACEAMQKSTLFDGMLARLGHQVKHLQGKERSSVLTTVVRHLRFLNTPAVSSISVVPHLIRRAKNWQGNGLFDYSSATHARDDWLVTDVDHYDLWVIVSKGLDEERLVHFILDEAAPGSKGSDRRRSGDVSRLWMPVSVLFSVDWATQDTLSQWKRSNVIE